MYLCLRLTILQRENQIINKWIASFVTIVAYRVDKNCCPFSNKFNLFFLWRIRYLLGKFRFSCVQYGHWRIIPTIKPHIISLTLLLLWFLKIYNFIFDNFYKVNLFKIYWRNKGFVIELGLESQNATFRELLF